MTERASCCCTKAGAPTELRVRTCFCVQTTSGGIRLLMHWNDGAVSCSGPEACHGFLQVLLCPLPVAMARSSRPLRHVSE